MIITRKQVIAYTTVVAKEEGLGDAATLKNIVDWKLTTIQRILEIRKNKYIAASNKLPKESPDEIDLAGKIWSIDLVLEQLNKI